MSEHKAFRKEVVRPIALAVLFSTAGFALCLLLEVFLDIEISRLTSSLLNLALAAFAALYIFPKLLSFASDEPGVVGFMRRLGLYLPPRAWRHVALGVALALCTLTGMLVSSILTGRYVLDRHAISVSHTVFSLNPAIWEEFYYRGVIMLVLLRYAGSLKRAVFIQVLLFGLLHIKGFGPWAWMDVVSVMILALAFTYVAYKTRALLAGIVFHLCHDALLFLVQVPDGEYSGFTENAAFYCALWIMVGLACLLTKVSAERLGVRAEVELYRNR